MIYFDNAATSWPKPPTVTQAISSFLEISGGNPGRSGHKLSMDAAEIIQECREELVKLFGTKNPMRAIFTQNATMALNLAIQGVLSQGDHVIISGFEHNSVLRPIHHLQQQKLIDYSVWQENPEDPISAQSIISLINSKTRMMIINHSSNVNGRTLPINELGAICRHYNIIFLVDAAQSAGTIPINMPVDNIDLLALAGHKGLYGPPGTGALIINDNFNHRLIKPLIVGGTGSLSADAHQPDFLPDALESGTPNGCGIAGLLAGIKYLKKLGMSNIVTKKMVLLDHFVQQSKRILGQQIKFYTNQELSNTGVAAFNLINHDPAEVGSKLSDDFAIMSRAGLHCAPLAHQSLKTYPTGCLRFSFSFHNSIEEIDQAIKALQAIILNPK